MAPNDFHQILWVYCTFESQQFESAYPEKIHETQKILFKFSIRFLMLHLNQLINFALIQYLGSSCKYLELFFFWFCSTLEIKGSSHKKKNFNFNFLKNGSDVFYQILWVYCILEPQQYDTIGFSRKNPCN